MKHLSLLAAALLLPAPSPASAQQRAVDGGARITIPSQSNLFSWERGHGFHGGFGGGIWIVEREVPVIVEKEVVRVTPPPQAATANSGTLNRDVPGLPVPRKPYVIGATYASLPGGCMKLIEEGMSFYYCGGGEWYKQTGSGRSARYQAVARKL